MTHMTLAGALIFGLVMIVLGCMAFALNAVRGPRRRPGALLSVVIIVAVGWRLSDSSTSSDTVNGPRDDRALSCNKATDLAS
jgi:hypothetical protein